MLTAIGGCGSLLDWCGCHSTAWRAPMKSPLLVFLVSLFTFVASPMAAMAAMAADAAEIPAPSATVGPDYLIGPGDTVQVFVWRNPDLTVTVPVRPDGKISTPLVEDMVAIGKTPSVLARDIETVLAEYVKGPQVNVIVTSPASTLSQIKVLGQVAKPQPIPYRDGMTVLDAVLAAGGVAEFAAPNRTKIVRTTGGKQVEIDVKLGRLLDRGDMSQNFPLLPGDVLVIPQSRF